MIEKDTGYDEMYFANPDSQGNFCYGCSQAYEFEKYGKKFYQMLIFVCHHKTKNNFKYEKSSVQLYGNKYEPSIEEEKEIEEEVIEETKIIEKKQSLAKNQESNQIIDKAHKFIKSLKTDKKNLMLVIIVGVALCVCVSMFCFWCCRKKPEEDEEEEDLEMPEKIGSAQRMDAIPAPDANIDDRYPSGSSQKPMVSAMKG